MIRLVFLGTGGSFGNPVLTCTCPSCRSTDPRDQRLRSSVLLEWDETRILVDAGLDFRQQALRAGIDRLDGVWFTHSHADHTGGVDDLRPYCFGGKVLPVSGLAPVMKELHARFAYAFRTEAHASGVSHPLLRPEILDPDRPFVVGGREVIPLPAEHGPFPVVGFRVGPIAYLTDVSFVPESTLARMEGLEVLVLSALRDEPHPTHLSFTQAVALAQRIGARRTWFTHFAHGRCHAELETLFPAGMAPAFDGMVINA